MDRQSLIEQLFEHDILITPDQAQLLTDVDASIIARMLTSPAKVEEYLAKLAAAKQLSTSPPPATAPSQDSPESKQQFATPVVAADNGITIVKHYSKKPRKRSYSDFVQYFNSRFSTMERMLRSRTELRGVMAIERVKQYSKAGDRQPVALIGLVHDKRETKNEHLVIELEDRSGIISVLITKNKGAIFEMAKDLCLDEIIGVTGSLKDDTLFADNIIIPGVPVGNELKRAPEEVYAVCVSDIHFGNKKFFEQEFGLFMQWLKGEAGSEESRRIAKKVKYVFIPGDIVEGVGVYPTQEQDLSLLDIFDQYKLADSVLSTIPTDKEVFIIPGNHDIGRLSEPQPAISKETMPFTHARPNTYFLSNPSVVRIHQTKHFPGFTCLLYHGGSFIYYGNNVLRLFQEGGMSNPVGMMQYLLQRRHLAPTHTATLYVPDAQEDALIIDEVPDFFITGHLHTTQAKTWNGITMLSCSCWTPITEYQLKSGLKIDPGKFMLINLQTRQVQALKPEDVL